MLGIVVLNYNSLQETVQCISSIEAASDNINYKIYLVDNCSVDDSYEKLLSIYSDNGKISMMRAAENRGFSAGNNVGFKKAVEDGCQFVLSTNADVIFKKDSIRIMTETMFEDENCGVVGPKVYCEDGTIQNCNKGILTARTLLLRKRGFRIFDWFGAEKKYSYRKYKYDKRITLSGMVSGCCFLIRAELLREIGYLDESVFLYHEEDILGAKIRATNRYYVCIEPTAEIVHLGGRSTIKSNAFVRYHEFKSGMYYVWRYTNVSESRYKFNAFMFNLMWGIMKLFNREYGEYGRKLKKDYKEIMKNEKYSFDKKE